MFKKTEVSIFPVPVKDKLVIKGVDNPNWHIYNIMGREILSGTGNIADVYGLKKTAYYIHIIDHAGNNSILKFVK